MRRQWERDGALAVQEEPMRRTCPTCGTVIDAGGRFCATCGAPLPGGTVGYVQPRATSGRTSDELRPVTALFADIVGSTSLGERLTPDEVKALIGECVTRMSRAVEEYGGVIQAYAGDGICAYFGVPAAHEDDPERAARAALRILQVVREYGEDIRAAWSISDFNVRVGINSGQTGVGMVGGATPQMVALGDTTNVAARLQGAAQPGTVAVGEATAKLLAPVFALESLGQIQVKGRAQAVGAWRLMGPRVVAETAGLTPLVGREQEMARLRDVIDQIAAGRGQVLLVSGEAGIGKTRLITEFRTVAGDAVTWLEGRCLPYSAETLSRPFVEMLRTWLGVEEGEAEVAVRMRLRARLGALLGPRLPDVIPHLANLLSVKLDPDSGSDVHGVTPQGVWEQIRTAFREWLEALTSEKPVVLAIDDFQWASPWTRALAEDLLEVTDRAPLLVTAAFRPDPASEAWRFRQRVQSDFPHRAVEFPLGPLSREACLQLADAIVPQGAIDDLTKEGLALRSEGNPLFLEELLRSLLESGGVDRGRSWTVTISRGRLLPASLESLFVARIDRLPPEPRRLAQIAAVIGRDFPAPVLERVSADPSFQKDLAALFRADLIREVRRYPELECTFKHGLVQEAALSLLTPPTLRELNGRVADVLEERFGDSIDDHLDELAYHYYRSDNPAKALRYLELAGAKAAAIHAGSHAGELWTRARKVASQLGDADAERRLTHLLASLDPEVGTNG